MKKNFFIKKHPLGFYVVNPKPTTNELRDYYSKKYYQEGSGSYSKVYTKDELKYFKVGPQITLKIFNKFSKKKNNNLLDLGCGEGFFADFFCKKGWKSKLVDFSNNGLKKHNPSLLKYFTQSDILDYLKIEKAKINKFDLINLDNVLEHVTDPIEILINLNLYISPHAILRIEVPNDFSSFQKLLKDLNCTKETWISPPEHLNYFNKDSLKSLLINQGFDLLSLQADFPIEQFLLNKHTNYWKNRMLGKGAHLTRVIVTNYLAGKNLDRLIDYQEAASDLEFGRTLIAYVRVARKLK